MKMTWEQKVSRFKMRVQRDAESLIGKQKTIQVNRDTRFTGKVVSSVGRVEEKETGFRACYDIVLEAPNGTKKQFTI